MRSHVLNEARSERTTVTAIPPRASDPCVSNFFLFRVPGLSVFYPGRLLFLTFYYRIGHCCKLLCISNRSDDLFQILFLKREAVGPFLPNHMGHVSQCLGCLHSFLDFVVESIGIL